MLTKDKKAKRKRQEKILTVLDGEMTLQEVAKAAGMSRQHALDALYVLQEYNQVKINNGIYRDNRVSEPVARRAWV